MKLIPIDTEKLRALIKNQGMNMASFGASLAHESSFVGKCIKRGSMQMHDIVLIRQMYETDIEYHPPKEEPKIIQGKQMSLDDMRKEPSHKTKAFYYHLLTEIWDVHFYLNHSDAGLDKTALRTVREGLLKMMDNVEQLLNVGEYLEGNQ